MAVERPWDGSLAAISMTQDRHAFGQMWLNLRYATVEPSTTYLAGLVDASGYAVHSALDFDAYTKVREGLQLDRDSQYARLQSFASSFVVQSYDWYLYRVSPLLALGLFCVTALATRETTFASVGLAIVGTALAYLLVCVQLTAFLPRYGLPTNFLMNLLSGLSLIQLLNYTTERIDTFRLQRAR